MKNIKDVFQKGNFELEKGKILFPTIPTDAITLYFFTNFIFFHDTKYLKFIHSFTYATISPHQNVGANILKLGPCVSFPLLPAKHLDLMPGI